MSKIQQLVGMVKLGAKRNAPELLLGLGLITGTATVIMTGRASIKAKALSDNFNYEKSELGYSLESGKLSEDELKDELKKTYLRYAASLAKEYAIPAALYAATIASVFSSYKIQKNRQMALSAALTACSTAYATLLGKIRNGAAHGLTAKEVLDGVEVVEKVDPETGEVTCEKVQGEAIESIYKARFDRYSPAWEKDKFQNECTLRSEENWANDKLRLDGYVFLNDVYDRLGLPRTQMGQVVGWLRDGNGDGFVDFRIKDCDDYIDERFDFNAFDLDFNVDGDVLSKFVKYRKDIR